MRPCGLRLRRLCAVGRSRHLNRRWQKRPLCFRGSRPIPTGCLRIGMTDMQNRAGATGAAEPRFSGAAATSRDDVLEDEKLTERGIGLKGGSGGWARSRPKTTQARAPKKTTPTSGSSQRLEHYFYVTARGRFRSIHYLSSLRFLPRSPPSAPPAVSASGKARLSPTPAARAVATTPREAVVLMCTPLKSRIIFTPTKPSTSPTACRGGARRSATSGAASLVGFTCLL